MRRITSEEVDALGWNTPEWENPLVFQRGVMAQLNQISHLLIEVGAELENLQRRGG